MTFSIIESIPGYLAWLKNLSFFNYAFEAMLVNEVKYLQLTEEKYGLQIDVPGATMVTNLEYDVEFLIVEHGKLLSLNDKKKELGDTAKSCTMLHDMIRRIHNNLTFCGSQSVQEFENFRVIAVVTSALEIKVFTLNLAGKELYIFQQIAGCILPQGFKCSDNKVKSSRKTPNAV
ncbi:12929_t:CDS:2 [Gigaspora rosea]|nr:12929_t:CDS:2 [Gigaspora rosea]